MICLDACMLTGGIFPIKNLTMTGGSSNSSYELHFDALGMDYSWLYSISMSYLHLCSYRENQPGNNTLSNCKLLVD